MNLAYELAPISWLVGTWRGIGTLSYPNLAGRTIESVVAIRHDGGPYLSYTGTLNDRGSVWGTEAGYFRVPPRVTFEVPDGAHPVELLLSDPAGYVCVYVGIVHEQRLQLATDLVARTDSGAEVTAGRRMYAQIGSDLFWAWDLAAFGQPLQSYVAAQLTKDEE